MLERTAGCLESGSLRRLLPGSKVPLKSRRTLHSGFWSHGAVDLELSPLWAALLRGPEPVDQDLENQQQNTSTGQGGMLLDFLYPAGTIKFFRHYSGWGVDRQDGGRSKVGFGKLGHRLYTSSASDGSMTDQYIGAIEGDQEDGTDTRNRKSLEKLMGLKSYDYEEAWRQYYLLGASDQERLRHELVEYFSTSQRVVDAERTTELFEQLDERDRSQITYRAAIQAYLRLRNLSDAITLQQTALRKFELPIGSAELLAYTIENSLWQRAFNTWKDFRNFKDQFPESSYQIFEALEDRPTLGTQAGELADYVTRRIDSASDSMEASSSPLLEFASGVVRRALLSKQNFDDSRFTGLLQILQRWHLDTAQVYEESIGLLLSLHQTKLAVQCYRKARYEREVQLTRPILHAILKIFCRYHSVLGMQQVLDDFFRFYSRPSRYAYRMCMTEFAYQGDATTVHALFEQYSTRFQFEGKPIFDANDIAPVLHVHAKRGELAAVVKAFNQIQDNYGLQPTLLCWNILINAYGKVHDTDGAFACFELLLESPDLQPDDYTFGTIMGICASRGDLDRAVELYKLAETMKIEKTAAVVDCLVLTYLRDERFQEAEKICEDSLRTDLKGSRTRMWNYLLLAYAMRRDLANVNRIFQRMSEAKVDYDEYTYSALMQALAMVGQTDRAYTILKDVMKDAGVVPSNFHYAVVMGGYIASGEAHKVFYVQNRMLRRDIRKSASTNLLAMKAAAVEDQKMMETSTEKEQNQRAFEIFQDIVSSMDNQDISGTARKGTGGLPLDVAYPSMFYSYIMFVLGQRGESETVNGLFERFKMALPESKRESPPVQVLSALMLAKMRSRDFEGVQECWNLAISQARKQGQTIHRPNALLQAREAAAPKSELPKILPAHQLDLVEILTTYMIALAKQRRVEDIPALIGGLLEEGFLLDNNNWNHYVQLMARRYRYKLAFEVCETKLMDGWTGWARIRWQLPVRNRLPIEVRNLKKMPKYLRPKYHTLLYLARGYLELKAMSAESKRSQTMLEELERKCPRTIHAIKTMQRTDDEIERQVLRGFEL